MKVFITKYALTQGVYAVEAETVPDYPDMIKVRSQFGQYFHKGDWAKTESEALLVAETQRNKKVHSLKKQISRLEVLNFRVVQ